MIDRYSDDVKRQFGGADDDCCSGGDDDDSDGYEGGEYCAGDYPEGADRDACYARSNAAKLPASQRRMKTAQTNMQAMQPLSLGQQVQQRIAQTGYTPPISAQQSISGGAPGIFNMPMLQLRQTGRKSSKQIGCNLFMKFSYNYRVAQMRNNINHSSKEVERYAEKYEKLRALLVAGRINDSSKKAEASMKSADNSSGTDKQKKLATNNLKMAWQVQKKFLQTVESVEIF